MAIRTICAFVVVLLGLEANPVFAGLIASAELVATPQGSDFNYNITLQNTGTTTVGTFWMGWVPGQDFMATSPISVTSPTGWTEAVTHGGASDGYAIQWIANSSSLLAAGHSLTFSFVSADTPASVGGSSVFYPGTPTTTSFVYSGAPFSDGGYQFVGSVTTASVPEPSSLFLLGCVVAVAMGVGYMRRKRPLVV